MAAKNNKTIVKGKRKGKRTKAIDDALCEHLAAGQTQRDFCRDNGLAFQTVYNWMEGDKDLASRVARARLVGEQMIEDEMLEIADSGDEDNVQHRKLRIHTRAQRLVWSNRNKYGTKTQVEQSITHRIELSDTEREIRIQQLLDKAKKPEITVEFNEEEELNHE